MYLQRKHPPYSQSFLPTIFDAIEKQLQRSAQNHYNSKGHRYTIQLLKQASKDDIFGKENEQSERPEYNIMLQKYKAMTLFEFLDTHP